MELPNIHFQDFPIEFKEINSTDFKLKNEAGGIQNGFNVSQKVIIEPNEEGFIYENLKPHLDLNTKDTVVINAPVGYGKSFAIIKTIEKIYKEIPNSLIIVATPFVSLVEQYSLDVLKDTEIPLEQIYDYSNLGRNSTPYINRRVQIVTVNSLLGNPGEDAFKNSDIKREYINTLIHKCKTKNSKVYFIYDEIHDAIQNFKEEYIFNLWKWEDVAYKNFIISATFNEASKVVIEYLAELTDRKIFIVEAIRKRFIEKQSSLHLHFSSEHNFTDKTEELVSVVENALNRNRTIDILCYSKSLAKSIIKSKDGIGKKLKDKSEIIGVINDCTSQLVSNQRTENEAPKNRYDNTKCNIGTNFKTGVSIKKSNHTFVIIMPPRATRLWFKNKYGIFSGGINSVIQALARQRYKGEIHIILPRPDKFNFESLRNARMTEQQISEFSKWYSYVRDFREVDNEGKEIKPVSYFPLNVQNLLLTRFYQETLKANVETEITHINQLDRRSLTRLKYPTYELFKLDKGEDFIANTFKFFGEDIAAYVTYCAFTNQFINCNLVEVNYKTTIFFEESKIQESLTHYFNKYFGEDYFNSRTSFSNFNMFYSEIRKELYSQFNIKYKKSSSADWITISSYTNKQFENQLIRFCAILYYQKNYYYQEDFTNRNIDLEYTRSSYFLDCISIANTINLEEVNYSQNYKNKIKAYKSLYHFRDKLIQSIGHSTRENEYYYLPAKSLVNFITNDDLELFNETILYLIEYDDMIKNDIFNFKRNFIDSTIEKKIESFYKILVEDFFEIAPFDEYPKATINGRRQNVKPINSIVLIPPSSNIINVITPSDYDLDYMNYLDNNVSNEYDSFENYQNIINSILKQLGE
jgi:hypothetical protein